MRHYFTIVVFAPFLQVIFQRRRQDQVSPDLLQQGQLVRYDLLYHTETDRSFVQSEEDILLRKELEAMAKRRPGQIELLFVLDKASKGWAGETGYVTPELLKKHLPSADLGDKAKVRFIS